MITIFKGDSMDSRFGRELTFSVDTTLDTTGCSIEFSINGVVSAATLANGSATVSFTKAQTDALDYGTGYASLALTDGAHRRTIKNDLPVTVTDSVAEVEGAENTIDIKVTSDWDEALKGVKWDAGGSIGSLRDFLARVGAALGASVTAR